MGIDKKINGRGDSHSGMRVARKAELRELFEFGADARELIHFPGWCSVVVNEPEERLLLSSKVTIECPCEDALRAHHEAEIRVHPASARRSIEASAAGSEFVEPNGCGQVAFRHQRTQSTTDWVPWIKAFGTERHV